MPLSINIYLIFVCINERLNFFLRTAQFRVHLVWAVPPIQHYVIKFASDLRQVCGFLRVLRFLPPIKLTAKI